MRSATIPEQSPAHQLLVLRSGVMTIGIRDGSAWRPNSWQVSPELKPDIYETGITGSSKTVTFISDVDSITFRVEPDNHYDFVILRGSDSAYTRIVGRRVMPAATFDATYRRENKGRIDVTVPEVHELVNIAIALTQPGINEQGLVYRNGAYYESVLAAFARHASHPLVIALDSLFKLNRDLYFTLKMNGYSFEFDPRGRIVKKRAYHRTGFAGEYTNQLEPLISRMQAFADETGFRAFYRVNLPFYERQIAFYRDTADIAAMRTWLNRNFPRTPYDSYKVVFSPLVASNQSATWLTSNGFRELQAHVNFPYPGTGNTTWPRSYNLWRGNIVFTEINHAYINTEAERYHPRILQAISNREHWVAKAKGPGFYGGVNAFNEYMNWGLAVLRLMEFGAPEERDAMIDAVVQSQVRRGFTQFPAFGRALTELYRGRKPGQTLADLYPAIIDWFAGQSSRP